MTDLRYALRTLVANPGFTTVAIATLALGIGANTAIFSVVNGVLLRPLPFRDADRIVRVWTSTADERRSGHAAGDFLDLQRENQSLAALAGYRSIVFSAVAQPGEPHMLEGADVTADFFDVLGVPAAIGRTFTRSADAGSGERLVVLSHQGWQQLYAGAADAIGQRLSVNSEPHTVVGVLPPRAEWPEDDRLWVLSLTDVPPSPVDLPDSADNRDVRYFDAIARLKPGIPLEQAEQDMARLGAIIQKRRGPGAQERAIEIAPLHEDIVGDVRFALIVMQAAVGLVLLIACANVSGLLLARAGARRRELAVRAALGASRTRLVRQLITESLALGAAGGVCGLLLGAWLIVLLTGILPANVPRTGEIALDRTVALITLLTAIGTGVLFGVMPALQAARADAASALKRAGGERSSPARANARSALVVAEVALTLVLLAGAGLLLNSFLRLQSVDSGLRPENVTVVGLMIPQSRYATGASQTELYRRLVEGLVARGEVQAAGVGFPGPLRGSNASGAFFIEGRAGADPADRPFANLGAVSGGYFAAMGIPVLSGRTFDDSDRRDAPPVGIASAALARKFWPGENAIGKRLRFDDAAGAPWQTIVGIVGDVRQLGLDQNAPPILYIPYQQFPLPFTDVVVRSAAPADSIASLIRAQLTAIDPELPPGRTTTLQGILDRSVSQPRFRTLVISVFAGIALVLAAVGVFGLISYSVTQRTREIGIRIALGAAPTQVLRPMVREGLVLAGLGLGIGLVVALLSARALSGFLYGVQATDPATFAVVALVLLSVACLATYVPARRVLRVDPIAALRSE